MVGAAPGGIDSIPPRGYRGHSSVGSTAVRGRGDDAAGRGGGVSISGVSVSGVSGVGGGDSGVEVGGARRRGGGAGGGRRDSAAGRNDQEREGYAMEMTSQQQSHEHDGDEAEGGEGQLPDDGVP